MNTQNNNLLGNSNTQNVLASALLTEASLLGGNTSLGITTQPANPLAAPTAPLTPLSPQALQQSPLLFTSTGNSSLSSSLPISNTNASAFIDPLTGAQYSQPVNAPMAAASTAPTTPAIPNFSIMAEGKININGGGDLDGAPLDPNDDALIYAGQGFDIKGNITLPTQRDAAGNILKDANNRSLLINNAVTVGPNYSQSSITGGNNYAGLNPPPVLSGITVDVPTFANLKQQELTTRIPAGTPTTPFNVAQNPMANAAQWNQKFPAPGTATQPRVVQVTGGGLTIPTGVTISNTVIIVDSGNITLSGNSHTLNNVTLIANNGNITLANAQTKDTSILASGAVTMNGAARFDGKTLIANGTGNLTFNGASKLIDATQDLTVISQGAITYNGAQNTRGTFLAAGNFTFNGNTQLYGRVKSKGDITFNGGVTFTGIGGFVTDLTPPAITASLSQDTAPNNTTNTDKITKNPTIVGSVTDLGQITELQANLNNGTNLNILPQRQADGSFTLNQTLLTQMNGGILPDGAYTLNLQAKDQAGNISNFQYSFTLDTTVATPTNLDLIATSDSGSSGTDNITKVNTPTITGKADAGTTVQLFNGTQAIGQATANATGDWQITTTALSNGTLNLTAIATDIAGNVSGNSTVLNITVDSVQPQFSLTTDTAQPLRDGAKLTGTVNGTGSAITSVTYRFDSGSDQVLTPNAAGSW